MTACAVAVPVDRDQGNEDTDDQDDYRHQGAAFYDGLKHVLRPCLLGSVDADLLAFLQGFIAFNNNDIAGL